MKVKIGDLTKIKTGKLDANASSEDGQYPFFTFALKNMHDRDRRREPPSSVFKQASSLHH